VRRRIQFIVNPVSGGRRNMAVVMELVRQLRERGDQVSVYITRCAGDARAFGQAVSPDVDVVVAVGGDGTANEVVQGLIQHPIPIALLPTGTENLLARQFGLRADADLLFETINANCRQWIDVGVVNGMHFMIIAGVGFDAEVVHQLVRRRTGHITYVTYFWPLWRTFWGYRFPVIRVTADGQELFEGRGIAFIGNIARYAIGLRILNGAMCDDGRLDLCIFPCRWQGTLLMHALRVLTKRHRSREDIIYRTAQRIMVESREKLPLQVDGDPAGFLPARFSVMPRRGIFLVPPPRLRTSRWSMLG
jgi:diacylglycerol kinase (ATP)